MEAVQTSVLARNLAALRKGSPDAAARIESAAPRPDARIITTDDGAWSVELGPQALASRRRPLDEARRFADTVDPRRAAIVVIGGFGAGHHVRAVAERLGRTGVVIVFEPDIPLLRAVLEHADCSAWFARHNVAILTDPDDGAAMAEVVRGLEGLAAMGVELAEHPPNRARLADALPLFHKRFIDLVRSLRMTVTTTLTQVPTTLANATQNIDHYALAEGALTGIDDLAGACAGRPALVISAGPGLAACLEALADPAVRDRCLIVAVQTVLRPLLRAGIRPHFVTALDYSEISARFYEGLTERDLHGITLVVEPKVNPAVTSAFSGRVRCTSDLNLDRLLGPELAAQRQRLEQGATVAHLAYYLARHCGCDPVGLIGQDLAFTDGAYYGPGASIHNLWACELNGFNTLELMEWLRIVRMAPHLRRATDVLNRPVFTDEQMDTYRLQFERDFRLDADRGLRVFDCGPAHSPGAGVRKQHAQPIALPDFLCRFASPAASPAHTCEPIDSILSHASSCAKTHQSPPTRKHILDRLALVRRQVWRLGELSRRAEAALTKMCEHHADQIRVNRLIAEVEQMRTEVATLDPGSFLVHTLNQSGSLERIRADRLLQIEVAEAERAAASGSGPPMDPFEVQRRTIERDLRNVRSLARSADEMNAMLRAAEESLNGTPKRTRRERLESRERTPAANSPVTSDDRPSTRPKLRVEALVLFDTRRTALGLPRTDLAKPARQSLTGPALCVRRLLAASGLDAVRIITDNPPDAQQALGAPLSATPNVFIEPLNSAEIAALDGPGRCAIAAARRAAPACWRGAPAGLTAFDEALEPAAMARIMQERSIDAALVVHADAWLICPERCSRLIERHRADPDSHRLVFSQDPPGLSAALLARSLMADIAALRAVPAAHNKPPTPAEGAGKFAGLSGALAYVPAAPAMDLIAQSLCIETPPALRDNPRRYLADTPSGRALLQSLIQHASNANLNPLTITAESLTQLAGTHASNLPRPVQLTLPVARQLPNSAAVRWASPDQITRALARTTTPALDILTVTLTGCADGFSPRALDPLEHPAGWPALLRAARQALPNTTIHLRTRLLAADSTVRALALDDEHRPDLLSVDLLAESAETYRAITTDDTFGLARRNIDTLLAAREQHRAFAIPAHTHGAWWSTPVIIARMVRCDAAYADVETFINRWMTHADWAVLDPLPASAPASLRGRIVPMPLPDHARARLDREHLTINPFAEDETHTPPAHIHLRTDDTSRARPAGAAP